MNQVDQALVDQTVRTNLSLIKQLNRYPEREGVTHRKGCLVRGIEALRAKTELDDGERLNLRHFNYLWSPEVCEVPA